MANIKKSGFKSALAFENRSLISPLQVITEQRQLLSLLRAALPVEIAEHVLHCVVSGKRLLVYTQSASWASQIRFFSGAILNSIAAKEKSAVTSLQLRIIPPIEIQSTQKLARLPSKENIGLINLQSRFDDGGQDELAQAWSRLAKTLDRRVSEDAP